jgi:ATP-dependent DNA helicase RecG
LEEYKKLSEEVFPNLRVGFVHGKLKVKEKDAVMNQFAEGELDILVSTSVVEVGVNIPNATVMMIEGAERFGLAQLHQFRGRVGRSDVQSYCMLFSESNSQKAKERLGFFEKNTDGFALAEYDLEQRGPGEVYGKQQSGIKQFRFASLSDKELIQMARNMAKGIDFNIHNTITQKVEEWERQVHLE